MKIFIIIVIVCIFSVFIITEKDEFDFVGSYQNLKEARLDINGHHGSWIPIFLPETATNLHIKYSISPGQYQLEFSYDPSEAGAMLEFFEPIKNDSKNVALNRFKEQKWEVNAEGNLLIYKYIEPSAKDNDIKQKNLYLIIDEDRNLAWCTQTWSEW